jgi:putative ABC transport system substrate-binding protein
VKRKPFGFIIAVALGLFAFSISAAAQQSPAKSARIGILSDYGASVAAKAAEPFLQGLRDLGYAEGKNIIVQQLNGDGKDENLPGLAEQMVRSKPDVLLTIGTPATRAAKAQTQTIPIVFVRIGDPIGLGLVDSLPRPGGNITGVTILTNDTEGKRLELLMAAAPDAKSVGALWDSSFPPAAAELKETEAAARALNLELAVADVRRPDDFESSLLTLAENHTGAVIVVPGSVFFQHTERLVNSMAKARLPAMYIRREQVEAGGLMSYATDYPATYRRAAALVDKILKGAKPADIPVEQPTKLELVINLKTARALGLTLPRALLLRADEVIE